MIGYEIVVAGRVQGPLLRALQGFDVVPGRPSETRFRGEVPDQAALHRVLRGIASCNLGLRSVRRIDEPVRITTEQGSGPPSA